MYNANFFGNFDGTSLILTVFVIFFVGLILYLRREDRREGYPLEDDYSGRPESAGGAIFAARPKSFILAHDGGVVNKPDHLRDSLDLAAARTSRSAGSPLEPTGNPLRAGVGPGSFAQRARTPDLMWHGDLKIAPLRDSPGFSVDRQDADPRGMEVVGADGVTGGVVTDIWVDRAEYLIRYLEVAVTPTEAGSPAPVRTVLVPMPMAVVSRRRGTVRVDAVLGSQLAGAPALASPDRVTFDEEERISAYYGGGYLYAKPSRTEPVI